MLWYNGEDGGLILASGSPRRRELMELYGIPFEIIPSLADENVDGTGRDRVLALARRKCAEVSARYPGRYVLAADTLVCVDDEILGKPMDASEAERMLSCLSGRAHEVHTGVCLRYPGGEMSDVETTTVHFMTIPQDAIRRYVQTGEPMDKAGAYAIQGRAGVFVSRIEGSPSNVVGLPLDLVTRFFAALGAPVFGESHL